MSDQRLVVYTSKSPVWWGSAERKVRIGGVLLAVAATAAALITHHGLFTSVAVSVSMFSLAITRGLIRRRAKKVPLQSDFSTLDAVPDRTAVRLRGCVRALDAATTARVVRRIDARFYVKRRRRVFARDKRITFHEADDFALVDAHGNQVSVRGAVVEVVAPQWRRTNASPDVYAQLEALERANLAPGWTLQMLSAYVTDISDGQEIELVGTKTREADADTASLPRDTPWRAVITAGELPVLIFLLRRSS